MGWDDVQHRNLDHNVGVIKRHAVRHAPAAVMPHGDEPVETEVLHHLNLVLRHRAFRVVGMILSVGRLAAIAVSTKVGCHDGVFLG
jgi:hypothetical protein